MPDAPESFIQIADGHEYALWSDGAGSAFVIRFKTEQLAAHLQADDAARFKADYETIRSQQPGWHVDQTLAQLWDQGGYSWLAVADGE
jgi:hypothetical protein